MICYTARGSTAASRKNIQSEPENRKFYFSSYDFYVARFDLVNVEEILIFFAFVK